MSPSRACSDIPESPWNSSVQRQCPGRIPPKTFRAGFYKHHVFSNKAQCTLRVNIHDYHHRRVYIISFEDDKRGLLICEYFYTAIENVILPSQTVLPSQLNATEFSLLLFQIQESFRNTLNVIFLKCQR